MPPSPPSLRSWACIPRNKKDAKGKYELFFSHPSSHPHFTSKFEVEHIDREIEKSS